MARWVRRGLRVLAVTAAVVLTLGLAAVASLPMFDSRAMIVTSGSMAPTISTGSLVVLEAVDPANIRPGDAITYTGISSSTVTTHRVIERTQRDGQWYFRTQGDANDAPDPDLAAGPNVIGRVRVDVPLAGYVLDAVQRPIVRFAVIGGMSAYWAIQQARALARAVRSRRADDGADPGAGVESGVLTTFVAVVAVSAIAAVGAVDLSGALLTDVVSITDNTFQTGVW